MVKFCTQEDVKEFAPINASFSSLDSRLDIVIASATQLIKQYCNRDFDKIVRTEFYDTPKFRIVTPFKFFIKEPPIDIAASFSFKLSSAFDWSDSTELEEGEGKEFTIDKLKGVITLFKATSKLRMSAKIVYTGGYAIDGTDSDLIIVPSEVKQATVLQANWLLQRALSQDMAQTEDVKSGERVALDKGAIGDLLPEARGLLASHRHMLLGNING